jgi:hypothetical protein
MLDSIDEILGLMEFEEQQKPLSALGLLQAVYRSPDLPLPTRMRAAALALPHESPRLTAIANVDVSDFSEKLERAILRTAAAYLPDKTRERGR